MLREELQAASQHWPYKITSTLREYKRVGGVSFPYPGPQFVYYKKGLKGLGMTFGSGSFFL